MSPCDNSITGNCCLLFTSPALRVPDPILCAMLCALAPELDGLPGFVAVWISNTKSTTNICFIEMRVDNGFNIHRLRLCQAVNEGVLISRL